MLNCSSKCETAGTDDGRGCLSRSHSSRVDEEGSEPDDSNGGGEGPAGVGLESFASVENEEENEGDDALRTGAVCQCVR